MTIPKMTRKISKTWPQVFRGVGKIVALVKENAGSVKYNNGCTQGVICPPLVCISLPLLNYFYPR